MKKTLLVVALAAILVFVFIGSAFAGINASGQDRLGAAAVVGSNIVVFKYDPITGLPTQTNPVAGAGTFIYMDWMNTQALGTNGSDQTPHGNYTTTTVKCVVCHAVHYAAPGGAPADSGLQDADTLLRMKASQSCGFCHATAGMAVNGRPVYDGQNPSDAQTGGGVGTLAMNGGHRTGVNCSMCHTSVHGMDQDNSVASLAGFLLKNPIPGTVGPNGAPVNEMIDAIQQIEDLATFQGFAAGAALGASPFDFSTNPAQTYRARATGIFCAECHNGAYSTVAAGATTNVLGSDTAAFTGHRLAAAENTWNDGNAVSSSLVNVKVAWAGSEQCVSCHDSKDNFGNQAFPHSWGDTKMWLTAKASVTGVSQNLPFGSMPNSGTNTDRPQLSDGVCLKCHVSATGAGVGLTY